MPSSVVGPGTLLAGRYRLEDHVLDASGTSYWRGVDQLLHRDVGVRTAPVGHTDARRLAAAARAAAGVRDGRFLAVLDITEDQGQLCVVSEWPTGATLEELLAGGPLPAPYAARIVGEVAQAMAGAHDARLWHGCLRPAAVVVQETGEVTLVGLEVDAVIAGLPDWNRADPSAAAHAQLRDTRGAGALLYAALTGRWPLDADTGSSSALPPARRRGQPLPAPRQLRGGLPGPVDTLVMRAMGHRVGHQPPLTGPRDLAAGLHSLTWPDSWRRELDEDPLLERTWPHRLPPSEPPATPVGSAPPRSVPATAPAAQAPGRRPIVILLVLLVATLVALVGWQAATTMSGERSPGGQGTLTSAPPDSSSPATGGGGTHRRLVDLPVVAINDVDPQGDGEESPDEVGYAVDHNPATAWTTRAYYRRPDLGGLKDGVGLLLDLGAVTPVSRIDLQLRGTGTALAVARGDSAAAPIPGGYTVLARAAAAGSRVTFSLDKPVSTRYLLVWLTRLPPDGPNTFRGGVAEINVWGMPPTSGGVG